MTVIAVVAVRKMAAMLFFAGNGGVGVDRDRLIFDGLCILQKTRLQLEE